MTKLHPLLPGHQHARDCEIRYVSPTPRAKLETFAGKNRVRSRPTKRTAMPGNDLRQLDQELAQQKPKFLAIHALLYSSPVRKTTKQGPRPQPPNNLSPSEDSRRFRQTKPATESPTVSRRSGLLSSCQVFLGFTRRPPRPLRAPRTANPASPRPPRHRAPSPACRGWPPRRRRPACRSCWSRSSAPP